MNIIFFTHPSFSVSQSMPRYANWLSKGMLERGHNVKVWSPQPKYFNLQVPKNLKKWMGYIDQYILFPAWVKKELKTINEETLFVLTDNALGPWVPLIQNKFHVVHCHDFLAQQSALNQIAENPTSLSGKLYQTYIRRGYREAKNFISISEKTRKDLQNILNRNPNVSEVVYNGLLQPFAPGPVQEIRQELTLITGIDLSNGYILHVGGNQWYKNKRGVIEIYNAWREISAKKLPLLLIGPPPPESTKLISSQSLFKNDIHFLKGLPDEIVKKAYQGASIFVFPSLAEGFGWPIAEAMASGSPVITTQEAPMNEVSSDAALFVKRRPFEDSKVRDWAIESAHVIDSVLNLNQEQRQLLIDKGLVNVKRFDNNKAIDKIEAIYKSILMQDH